MSKVTWDKVTDLVKERGRVYVYACRDTRNGGIIEEDACIEIFGGDDALERAREYLLEWYDAHEFDVDAAVYTYGDFDDCWQRFGKKPTDVELERFCGPFGSDNVRVDGPGHHPGGREWWVRPQPDILTISSVPIR
ncbi:MAG: hypothetical protein ACXIUP_07560 [Microcella sp.]